MSVTTRRPDNRRTESSSQGRSVQRWDPFREFEQLQEEMGRLVQNVWPQGEGGPWIPVADIEETDDAWVIEAELPGVDRKDVNVEMREGELVITGEIKEKERKGVLRRRTRRTGQFEYRIVLPAPVKEDQIEANLHDGVLTVRVPKAEKAQPRRIEVKAS
jgi:HSP20 family protein